jgi:hypothetical protein
VFGGLWSVDAATEDKLHANAPGTSASASTSQPHSDNAGASDRQSNGAGVRMVSLEEEKQRGLAHRAREPSSNVSRPVPPLILVANKVDIAGDAASAQQSLPDEVRPSDQRPSPKRGSPVYLGNSMAVPSAIMRGSA